MNQLPPRMDELGHRHQAGDGRFNAEETSRKMNDHTIPIVLFHANHKFELDRKAMENILLQDDVKDRVVVVVSIAGSFRKGKSFLLDFFLRYMYHTYDNNSANSGSDDWMGKRDEPLEGFSWKGGSDRNTTGILMWSKVFQTTLKNGEKAAIVLIDTQGTFDSQSTVRDCATVFALSTMTSSIQIYNISQNIQEDDLHHLELFTEYGKLALEQVGKTPFQKLLFLVRDWSYPYEADYGELGGRSLLRKRLRLSLLQHPELQSIRRHIKACFSDIGCFLMPHPGLKVATNPSFDGRLCDIEEDFKIHLKALVESLLAPGNLVSKEIGGQKVRAKELIHYFQSYVDLYSGSGLPEPKTLLGATAEANNLTAVASAKELYSRSMEDFCGGSRPYISPPALDSEHARAMSLAMELFEKTHKMGGIEYSECYRSALSSDLNEMFLQFKRHNQSKNIFNLAQTPATLVGVATISYFLSGFFGLIGFYFLANGFNLFFTSSVLTLVVWLYVHYSGEMSGTGDIIDLLCSALWESAVKRGCAYFKEGTRRHSAPTTSSS